MVKIAKKSVTHEKKPTTTTPTTAAIIIITMMKSKIKSTHTGRVRGAKRERESNILNTIGTLKLAERIINKESRADKNSRQRCKPTNVSKTKKYASLLSGDADETTNWSKFESYTSFSHPNTFMRNSILRKKPKEKPHTHSLICVQWTLYTLPKDAWRM